MTAYVVAPHDIVVARSFSWDDRIAWLLSLGRFELALTLASRHTASLSRHTPLAIAEQYAASLLEAPHVAPASCAPGSSLATRARSSGRARSLCTVLAQRRGSACASRKRRPQPRTTVGVGNEA